MNVISYFTKYYLLLRTKKTQYPKQHRSTTYRWFFFYLDGPKFVHAKISLRAHCVHARHRARSLSSPETTCISKQIMRLSLRVEFIERDMTM